jgi:hypothetical protein
MSRAWLAIAMAALLSACADDTKHHGPPPHDPADYHGVPTDDRPPNMIDTAPSTQ